MSSTKVSLIVQPGDSFFPIVDAIDSARSSVNITIFRMDDPVIERALLEAVSRGVRVRALIASHPRGWEKQNKKVLTNLTRAGVETQRPAGDSKKRRYHYKILTIDRDRSLVLTFNPTRENLHYTRDYGAIVQDRAITAELRKLFDADWNNVAFRPDPLLPLAISPYDSRPKIIEFLKSAERSIDISDAKLRDSAVLALLREKASRGVRVRVLGSDPSYADRVPTIHYRQITRFKMHAKCVVVDASKALIGSMNLRAVSLDRRREVGVFVDDPKALVQLEHVFDLDWNAKSSEVPSAKRGITAVLDEPPDLTLSPDQPAASVPGAPYALLSRTDALTRFPLFAGDNSIGRSSDNDIVITHPSVSRAHAKIVINGRGPVLHDLRSQNGTYLNGEQITSPTPLEPGDIISIAQSDEFRFIEV
jgi:cardiolipin synthase